MSQLPPTGQPPRPPRFELSIAKIIAGALAAASAAVASSWLGLAGTVFGAVVVSVIATVGTALYAHSLERSQYVIRETIPVLAPRTRLERMPSDDPETMVLTAATATPAQRPVNWPTVAVSCVATLILGIAMLTGFEAVVGKSASELTGGSRGGGTTLGSIVDSGSGGTGSSKPSPAKPGDTPANQTTQTTTQPTTSEPTTPATTGPTTSSPTSTAPTSTAPTSTSPTSTSPTSTSPTSTSPTSTGPTSPPTTTGP